MFTFKQFTGIHIPKVKETEVILTRIKSFLERRIAQYNTSDFVLYKFYKETDKEVIVPRFFPLERFTDAVIENRVPTGNKINITHSITLRSRTQRDAITFMQVNKNGILQLLPGVGKTIISIHMIAERKLKSFILVHRDSLVDQWTDKILQFTNINPDNIVRLRSSSFVKDLQKDIIICTSQTFVSLLKRQEVLFLDQLYKSNIGIFIADEIHTSVGAPTFSNCSLNIPAKYVYGLSATPYRNDGTSDIIEYHLGKIFSDEDTEGTMTARVTVLLFDYGIDIPRRYKYLYWGGDFQRSRYLNMMIKSKIFMNVSMGILSKTKKDRDLLFISERIKLIDKLYDLLDFQSKSKFIGVAKMDQLESKVVFATPGKIRDGIDVPKKDTLIMTSPISNIEQIAGRVLRVDKNKKEPVIIDMVDFGCKRICGTFFKRNSFYKKKEWTINYVLLLKNQMKTIDEEVAIKILKGEEDEICNNC